MKITAITTKGGIPMEPSFDTALSYAANAGTLIAGFAVANVGLRLIKMQDNALANAGVGVAALIGASMVSNPFIQLGLLAVAGFTLTKAAVLATKAVIAPGAAGLGGVTGFISGLIPDSIKAHINSALPSFGEIGDFDSFSGGDNEFGNLDEPINGAEDLMGNSSENLLGDGRTASLLM